MKPLLLILIIEAKQNMIITRGLSCLDFVKAKFQDGNFFVMKSFVASICLTTFICNHSFGVIEDEDKSMLFNQLHCMHLQILVKCTYDQSNKYKKKFTSLDKTQYSVEEQSHQ